MCSVSSVVDHSLPHAVSPPRLRIEETTTDGTDGTDIEEDGTEGREETRRMMIWIPADSHRFVAFVSFCKNEFNDDAAVSPPRLLIRLRLLHHPEVKLHLGEVVVVRERDPDSSHPPLHCRIGTVCEVRTFRMPFPCYRAAIDRRERGKDHGPEGFQIVRLAR